MIASVHGKVTRKQAGSVVIEVNGIGFEVFVTDWVNAEIHPGESLSLFTSLIVREDDLSLYGFRTQEEVDLFSLLLRVNGVGPRLALETLSTHSPEVLKRAVVQNQAAVFTQVSGIGGKTAQKIILHLEDRIPAGEVFAGAGDQSEIDMEVQEALVGLGYSVVEAQLALQSLPDEAPNELEERITLALRYFS